MLQNSGLPTISELEELWAPDIEEAFIEAIQFFSINGPKMIYNDGKKIGRNKLIAEHIKKKCGKSRSPKQVSSHIQVYKKKHKSNDCKTLPHVKINTLPQPKYLVAPEGYFNNLLGLSNFGPVKFLQTKENEISSQYFTVMEHLLESMHEILPIRRISSDKLALCSMLTYVHDRNTLCNTIIRGFTCATEANILNIPIRNIYHQYGNDLINLYRKVPMNAFYLVKNFVNLNFPIFDDYNPVDYICDQKYYSRYPMDIEMTATIYIFGKPIYTLNIDLAIDKASIADLNYYIYHLKLPQCNSFIQKLYQEVLKLKELGDNDLIRTVIRNHTRLVILREKHTREVLLVIACMYDYLPNFTGYRFYKIVP